MSRDDHAVGEAERLHPLILLTGLGGSLRGMAGGYAFIGYLALSGRLQFALLAALALFVMLAIGMFLYWSRFEYRVGANEIRIDSGIISRTHRSIPFDRVQDVDIAQGPLARLLGLAKVKFETGASAGQEEGVLQAITLERAQQLRELVRARRSSATPVVAGERGDEGEERSVYALALPRLLLAGVFNFSLAVFAGLFGLSQVAGDVIGFDPLNRSFWTSMLSANSPIAQFILAHQVVTAIAGLLSLVLIGIGTGIVRTVLRDFGFRLDRTDTGLRRRRGLISLTDVTLPLRRAQAAILATGPVRERFGWKELKLQSLARDEAGSGDHVLAPLANDEEANEILSALGWRRVEGGLGWMRVSRAYAWILTIALMPLLLIALVQMLLVPIAGLIGAAIIVLWIALRWLAWRRTAYALEGDRLLIRTGWWRRRTLVLPIRKIQSMDLHETLVSRLFGTASLTFGVAGGSGLSAHSIPALPGESARELRQELLGKLL